MGNGEFLSGKEYNEEQAQKGASPMKLRKGLTKKERAEAKRFEEAEAFTIQDREPIIFPEKVQVLDCKHGNTIGYRDRKEVFELVQEDIRFIVNVTSAGELQLIYTPQATLSGMTIMCESLDMYMKYIKAHLKTAVACDEPARNWLQVSFDHNKHPCVVALPLNESVFNEMAKGGPVIEKALKHCTTSLIKYLKKLNKKES